MMPSRRKLTTWTYRDDVKDKDYPIQVYALVDDGRISFEAEVFAPIAFKEYDENAQVLHQRVFDRLVADEKVRWETYLMLTISRYKISEHKHEPEPGVEFVVFDVLDRTFLAQVTLLIGRFESAVLPDGTRLHRSFFAGRREKAEPGWPDYSPHTTVFLPDTPENRGRCYYAARRLQDYAAGLLDNVRTDGIIPGMPAHVPAADDTGEREEMHAQD